MLCKKGSSPSSSSTNDSKMSKAASPPPPSPPTSSPSPPPSSPPSISSASSIPGKGWTNNDIPHQMYPLHNLKTNRIELYSTQRRLIHTSQGWTRIGDADPNDAFGNAKAASKISYSDPEEEVQTVKALMSQLCESFYKKGWQMGTGGGISVRIGDGSDSNPYRVFTTPSGIQKDDMVGDDVFVMDMNQSIVQVPKTPGLKISSMTSLWYIVYRLRPKTMCVVHTHSMYAQLATMLDPTESCSTLRVTHLEMIKGVGNHGYEDMLEIPIIDNQSSEDKLGPDLAMAIMAYPKCNAVLVRRHGVYVWGDSWEQAKTQLESFDYLFETAVRMKSIGLDCGIVPVHSRLKKKKYGMQQLHEEEQLSSSAMDAPATQGIPAISTNKVVDGITTRRTKKGTSSSPVSENGMFATIQARQTTTQSQLMVPSSLISAAVTPSPPPPPLVTISNNKSGEDHPPSKKRKTDSLLSTPTVQHPERSASTPSSFATTPIIPTNTKTVIMTLTGCIVPTDLFHGYIYPFVLDHVDKYFDQLPLKKVSQLVTKLNVDTSVYSKNENTSSNLQVHHNTKRMVMKAYVKAMIKYDVQRDDIQELLCNIISWTGPKANEALSGMVCNDIEPFLHFCQSKDVNVYVFANESVHIQKMLFLQQGRGLSKFVTSYHDSTTIGPTNEIESFLNLRDLLQLDNGDDVDSSAWKDVVFLSASEDELEAAVGSGIGYPILCRGRSSQMHQNHEESIIYPVVEGLGLMTSLTTVQN